MKYCIGGGVLGGSFLDISADDFEKVKAAKRNLLVLLGIEEKYEMLIANYLEYENTLLDLALAGWAFTRPAQAAANTLHPHAARNRVA